MCLQHIMQVLGMKCTDSGFLAESPSTDAAERVLNDAHRVSRPLGLSPALPLQLVPWFGFPHKISFEKRISVASNKVCLFLKTNFLFFSYYQSNTYIVEELENVDMQKEMKFTCILTAYWWLLVIFVWVHLLICMYLHLIKCIHAYMYVFILFYL